jgi:hypothetical protein
MTTRSFVAIRAPRGVRGAGGQSIMEFALIMPLALALALGVVEVGYALLDQHVVTKLAREGSNLISRETPLPQAAQALTSMSSTPVNFADGSSRLIFSVIRRGATTGTANYNQMVLWQRFEAGSLPASSKLNGSGSFQPPEYTAPNSDSNTALRVTNLPGNLATVPGGMIYVTEIYTSHDLITPFDVLGVVVPSTLYSIAFF